MGSNTTVISVRGSGAVRDNTTPTTKDNKEDAFVSKAGTERTNSGNNEDVESPVS